MNKLEHMIYTFTQNECIISKRCMDESFIIPNGIYNMISLVPHQNSLDIEKLIFYTYTNKLDIESIILHKFKKYLSVEGNTFVSKLMVCISSLDSETKNVIVTSHKKYTNYYDQSVMELRIINSIIINHFILGLVCYLFLIEMACKEYNIDKSLIYLTKQKKSTIFSRRYMEFMKLYFESIISVKGLEKDMAILSLEFVNIWQPFFIESEFEFCEETFAKELRARLAVKNVNDANDLLELIHEEKRNIKFMQDNLRELMIEHQNVAVCMKSQIKNELKGEIEKEILSELAIQVEKSKKQIQEETSIILNTINENLERGFYIIQNMFDESLLEISRSNSLLIKDFTEVIEYEVSKVIDYMYCKINPETLEISINAIIPIKVDDYLKTLGFRKKSDSK